MKDYFSKFDKAYHRSKEFPAAAIAEILAQLLHAIDNGNEVFFANIKQGLPAFYQVLIEECSPTCSLEILYPEEEDRPASSLYHWGLNATVS